MTFLVNITEDSVKSFANLAGVNRHWWLNACNTRLSNSLKRFFLRIKLQILLFHQYFPLLCSPPVHHTLLVVSVFSVYSYRNDTSLPKAYISVLSFPCPRSTCVKACRVIQEILWRICHSVKCNLLQLQRPLPPSLFVSVKGHADTLLLIKKESKKIREQWRQISCQYLLQNNVNPMSKWDENLV